MASSPRVRGRGSGISSSAPGNTVAVSWPRSRARGWVEVGLAGSLPVWLALLLHDLKEMEALVLSVYMDMDIKGG